jgi:hypothetical protein
MCRTMLALMIAPGRHVPHMLEPGRHVPHNSVGSGGVIRQMSTQAVCSLIIASCAMSDLAQRVLPAV